MVKQISSISKLNMILENSFASSMGKDKTKLIAYAMNSNMKGLTLLYIPLLVHIITFL